MHVSELKIGLIGYGRFARVLESLLKPADTCIRLKIYSRSSQTGNEVFATLNELLKCDVVVPCMPIGEMEQWLVAHRSEIRECSHPGQIWLSIASVMAYPREWFEKHLPAHVEKVVSHPIFGPNSSKQGTDFNQLPWVFDLEESDPKLSSLRAYLIEQGIKLHYISAREHDRIMARSQAVAFLFGEIGTSLAFNEGPFDTVGFKHLLNNQRIYESDSRELLLDMFRFNAQARENLKAIRKVLEGFEAEVSLALPLKRGVPKKK